MDFDETTAPAFTGTDMQQLVERVAAQNGAYPAEIRMGREAYMRLRREAGDNLYANAHENFDGQGIVGRYIGTPIYLDDHIHGNTVFITPANNERPVKVVYEGNIERYDIEPEHHIGHQMIAADADTNGIVYNFRNGDHLAFNYLYYAQEAQEYINAYDTYYEEEAPEIEDKDFLDVIRS